MFDEIGVDDGIKKERINRIVHVIIHIIIRPSCPVLEVKAIVTSPSLLLLARRHGNLLKIATIWVRWNKRITAVEASRAEPNDPRRIKKQILELSSKDYDCFVIGEISACCRSPSDVVMAENARAICWQVQGNTSATRQLRSQVD